VKAQAADVRVQVLSPATIHSIARDTWNHPTLMVCLIGIPGLSIRRGKILMTRPIPKLQQAEMMKLGGIQTPHVELYNFGAELDPAIWGSHVVLKPHNLQLTSKGQGLEIMPTEKLSGMQAQDFAPDHFVHQHKMLVQRFIDTGRQPVWYRACTFMGEVLYIIKAVAKIEKDATGVPKDFHSKGELQSFAFEPYPHIHAFARKVAAGFPFSPLLGCDILEEHGTGDLYALEVNAGGNVWHFSSPFYAQDRIENPQYNELRLNQYNAFDTAAKALISATRRLAV
ncbi:MAG: hypothetical protein NWR47_07980, partial [Aestuariivirgaceae bacterium]|nr:hypothetical protein [Aestuariivirgaceae bacterium]